MILDIFKDSFEYSYKEPKTLFKVGILALLSVFIIPIFFVLGYYYRVNAIGLNGTINGDDPLPKFNKWGILFIEGVKVFLVRFIYLLPGTLVYLIPHTSPWGMTTNPGISIIGSELGILSVTVILWLIFYLFSTVAVTNMVNTGSFKAAFDFKEIMSIIRSIGFWRYVKFYFGCIILGIGLVGTAFGLLTLIGLAFAFLVRLNVANIQLELGVTFVVSLLGFVASLFLIPFFLTFESRAIALIYNMRELD